MKYAVDLHIHSALSPCGEEEMTPNNIANMAMLKGLEIVALTDHNSYFNSKAFEKIAQQNGILSVFGMEVTTAEEIHILVLMPDYERLEKLGKLVYLSLVEIDNKPEIFGRQLVLDEEDEIVREESRLLISATTLTVDDVFSIVQKFGGVAIPAHIDRNSYSMLESFGMIPKELGASTLELSKDMQSYFFKKLHPELEEQGYRFINSSDAHRLEDIFEDDNKIELEEKTVECLLKLLKTKLHGE